MADDNTSVGKISLEIDLSQDLEKEIGNAANIAAKGFQDKLKNTKVEFGSADISKITKTLDEIPKQITSIMDKSKAIMENATQSMRNSIENNVIKALQSASSFKAPKIESGKISNTNSNVSDYTQPVLNTKMPEVYTPKVNTDFIDAEFTDIADKADNVMKLIGAGSETTAKKATSNFSDTSNEIKDSFEETIDTTEKKADSTIASITAKLKNIQLPKFDFSNIKMPKFNFPSFQKQEPVLGTETQRIQLDLLTRQMDAFSDRADNARQHINELKAQIAELSKPSGSPIVDFINSNQIDKLKEALKAAELEEQKFGDKSDSINIKIMQLEEKMKAAANATNNNTRAVKGKGDSLDSTGKKGSLFGSIFERLTGIMKSSESGTKSCRSEMDRLGLSFSQQARMLGRMLVYMSLYNTVIRGLGDVATYMGSAFMANEQFRNSIMQTRSNLMTAFQPIYNAILPALQALASALATVSAYIASFMSQLFGTTYQASFAGASALQKQVGSLDMTDKQAKKTADSLGSVSKKSKDAAKGISEAADASKKGLAGFDELNKLGETTPKTPSSGTPEGSGVTAPITPMANMSPIEAATQGFADKLRSILAGIWQPFKDAWAAQGLNTINAAKYALGGILDLVGSIAKSFYTVWTNGTGTSILENWLKLLQQQLKLIGDIGHTFANAWNSGNIGTQIIQSIANAFNNILVLETKITQSMRKVWAEEGPTFAGLFMQALKATTGVIENVTQKLGWIWDHGGQHAFEGLLKLGAKIGELALYIYTNFVIPFINWFIDKISPAIAKVLDVIGKLADKMSQLISWLMGSGKPVLDVIVTVVGSIWLAFKTMEGANAIVKGIKGTIDTMSNSIKATKAVITEFGDNFNKVKGIVSDAATAIANFGKKATEIAWKGITDGVSALSNGFSKLKGLIADGASAIADFGKKAAEALVYVAKMTAELALQAGKWIADKAAIVASTIAEGAMTAAQWLLDAAMDANPISIMIIAITGLVASFVIDYNKCAWFRNGVNAIFRDVGSFFKGVVNEVISGINFLIRALDKIKVPNINIPGIGNVGGFGFSIGQIPYLATGGVIDQPTLAMVGEAGKEAVMPLENNTGWIDTLASKISEKILVPSSNSSNNDKPIDLSLEISLGDNKIYRNIIKGINDVQRQAGKTLIQI